MVMLDYMLFSKVSNNIVNSSVVIFFDNGWHESKLKENKKLVNSYNMTIINEKFQNINLNKLNYLINTKSHRYIILD